MLDDGVISSSEIVLRQVAPRLQPGPSYLWDQWRGESNRV